MCSVVCMEYKFNQQIICFLYFFHLFISVMKENHSATRIFLQDFTLAGISGSLSETILAPFANFKILYDQRILYKYAELVNPLSQTINYIKTQRLSYLWKNNQSHSFNAFFAQGLFFSVKQFSRKLINPNQVNLQTHAKMIINFLSGAIAATVTISAVYPLSWPRVLKVQMKGFKDFYKNFWIHLIPLVIYRGTQISIFDSYKIGSYIQNEVQNIWKFSLLSISSTFFAQLASSLFWNFQTVQMAKIAGPNRFQNYLKEVGNNTFDSIYKYPKIRFLFAQRIIKNSLILALFQNAQRKFSNQPNLSFH